MEIDATHYVVTVNRVKRDSKFDARYELTVKVNGESLLWNFYYTLKGARRKALRAILNHQKEVDKGVKFGIVFGASGDVEEMKRVLK